MLVVTVTAPECVLVPTKPGGGALDLAIDFVVFATLGAFLFRNKPAGCFTDFFVFSGLRVALAGTLPAWRGRGLMPVVLSGGLPAGRALIHRL